MSLSFGTVESCIKRGSKDRTKGSEDGGNYNNKTVM